MYTMYNTNDQSTQQPIMLTINSNKHSTTEINSMDVTRGTHTHTHHTLAVASKNRSDINTLLYNYRGVLLTGMQQLSNIRAKYSNTGNA